MYIEKIKLSQQCSIMPRKYCGNLKVLPQNEDDRKRWIIAILKKNTPDSQNTVLYDNYFHSHYEKILYEESKEPRIHRQCL